MMRRRDCDASVTLLETAVELAGADSRRGGEFKLWAAQALQGVGRNKQAVEVLKSLKGHRDLDVRKVLVCVRVHRLKAWAALSVSLISVSVGRRQNRKGSLRVCVLCASCTVPLVLRAWVTPYPVDELLFSCLACILSSAKLQPTDWLVYTTHHFQVEGSNVPRTKPEHVTAYHCTT